jgi:predicted ATP-dependent endonuclease of OLD family
MYIRFVEIQNFRKLKSIRIDLTPQTTVFVGANNSGKTSAIAALRHFLKNQSAFTTNDFTLSNWTRINKIGADWEAQASQPGSAGPSAADWAAVLPSLDLWLQVEDNEIHYVSHLLPTLDWEGGLLGVRLRLEPKNIDELYKEFLSAIRKAKETLKAAPPGLGPPSRAVALWPETMRDFLERRLRTFLTVRAYSLDPSRQTLPEKGVALPQPLPVGSEPIDGEPLKGLIRIDLINAQRDFADPSGDTDRFDDGEHREPRGTRRLSAQLRSYYDEHLDPQKSPAPSDLDALRAIQEAQTVFDARLKAGFSAALKEVEELGYPGDTDPKLTIATKLRLTDGLNHDAAVQYDVVSPGVPDTLRLPEDYNGLGYQNLISMVFRLMSFRDSWMQVGKVAKTASPESGDVFFPPPLHLILIEEPEAHLHAQVQQVFIRKAYTVLRAHDKLGRSTRLSTQLVVSTHSSHIAHECEFFRLRYFRRLPPSGAGEVPITTVINLSEVFGANETERFVTRYLKATHCDLFFADAAILVEGPAERILVPQFVREYFPELHQSYVTLLEIGGSHAHRLRRLIEKLGLTTLVITDLDAAESPAGLARPPERGKGQVTRNATLKTWLPNMEPLDDLLDARDEQKVRRYDQLFSVRVAYQCPLQVQLNETGSPIEVAPSTFEDALVFGNISVFRVLTGVGLIGKFQDAIDSSNGQMPVAQAMFELLKTAKKAEFALDLLELQQESWPIEPPAYIREGLEWLQTQLHRRQQELSASSEPPAVLASTVA